MCLQLLYVLTNTEIIYESTGPVHCFILDVSAVAVRAQLTQKLSINSQAQYIVCVGFFVLFLFLLVRLFLDICTCSLTQQLYMNPQAQYIVLF